MSRLFIGSSTENLDAAYAAQENLDHDIEVTVWTQGIFELSKTSMESLVTALDSFHFGLFILAPDDVTRIRGNDQATVRDNVIFELGLFVGRLGRKRTFLVIPRQVQGFHLPTDLLGITPGTYDPNRRDGNLTASLGPACNQVRKAIGQIGTALRVENSGNQTDVELYDENDIISIIESWMGARGCVENTKVIRYVDVDQELGLPEGSAEKYIVNAARSWEYTVTRKGKHTIKFDRSPFIF